MCEKFKPTAKHVNDLLMSKKNGAHRDRKNDYDRRDSRAAIKRAVRGGYDE